MDHNETLVINEMKIIHKRPYFEISKLNRMIKDGVDPTGHSDVSFRSWTDVSDNDYGDEGRQGEKHEGEYDPDDGDDGEDGDDDNDSRPLKPAIIRSTGL